MCIRDRYYDLYIDQIEKYGADYDEAKIPKLIIENNLHGICLLYTSDAADERSSVDLGGRRIIKKKKN